MAILSGTSPETESPRPSIKQVEAPSRSPALRTGGPLLRAALRMALALVLGIAMLHWLSVILQVFEETNGGYDFISYYAAALALRDNPAANIYALHTLQVAALAHHAPYPGTAYIYPPLLALLMIPLTWLPATAALNVWLAFNFALWLACLALIVWLLRALLVAARFSHASAGGDDTRLFLLAVVAFLALTYDPLAEGIGLGQIHVLICFLVLLALVLEQRGRPGLAGAALAVACLLKVYPLVLLGYFLLRGRWRVLGGAAIAFVLLVLGMLPFLGIQGLLTMRGLFAAGNGEVLLAHNEALLRAPLWLATLVGASPGTVTDIPGVVLVGLVGLAFAGGTLWAATRHTAARAGGRYGWQAHAGQWAHAVRPYWLRLTSTRFTQRDDIADIFGYLWALCTMVLVAPVSWEHSYTWLLPALILSFVYVMLVGDGSRLRTALLLAAILLGFALTTADFPLGFDQRDAAGPIVFGYSLRAIFMLLRPLGGLLVWSVCGWLHLSASRRMRGEHSAESPVARGDEEMVRQWPARSPRRFAAVLVCLLGAVMVVRGVIVTVMVIYGAVYGPTALR